MAFTGYRRGKTSASYSNGVNPGLPNVAPSGKYKSRKRMKFGNKIYEKRTNNSNTEFWFEFTNKGWEMIRSGAEFNRLDRLLAELQENAKKV